MTTYYKVLLRADDGTLRSFNGGGDCVWPEPRDGQPGDWLPPRPPRLCSSGYHLTSEPARWWGERAECYVVEYDGLIDGEGHKIAVERARLVRRLTDAELAALQIFVVGEHEVLSGIACATGSARVVAHGSARVVAHGSARVTAHGTAEVVAFGSARISARDSARVTAHGTAEVEAFGSAGVEAFGSARISACDSATVVARDSARVVAYGHARVNAYGHARVVARGSATVVATERTTVELHDSARCVDRR